MLRFKTCWTEWGEKPTKYLFNLEREITTEKKTEIKHLPKAGEIMKEMENFYRDLYTFNGDLKIIGWNFRPQLRNTN